MIPVQKLMKSSGILVFLLLLDVHQTSAYDDVVSGQDNDNDCAKTINGGYRIFVWIVA